MRDPESYPLPPVDAADLDRYVEQAVANHAAWDFARELEKPIKFAAGVIFDELMDRLVAFAFDAPAFIEAAGYVVDRMDVDDPLRSAFTLSRKEDVDSGFALVLEMNPEDEKYDLSGLETQEDRTRFLIRQIRGKLRSGRALGQSSGAPAVATRRLAALTAYPFGEGRGLRPRADVVSAVGSGRYADACLGYSPSRSLIDGGHLFFFATGRTTLDHSLDAIRATAAVVRAFDHAKAVEVVAASRGKTYETFERDDVDMLLATRAALAADGDYPGETFSGFMDELAAGLAAKTASRKDYLVREAGRALVEAGHTSPETAFTESGGGVWARERDFGGVVVHVEDDFGGMAAEADERGMCVFEADYGSGAKGRQVFGSDLDGAPREFGRFDGFMIHRAQNALIEIASVHCELVPEPEADYAGAKP